MVSDTQQQCDFCGDVRAEDMVLFIQVEQFPDLWFCDSCVEKLTANKTLVESPPHNGQHYTAESSVLKHVYRRWKEEARSWRTKAREAKACMRAIRVRVAIPAIPDSSQTGESSENV